MDSFSPLAGVRVVSIALNLPGPTCVQRLVHYGASVIKVEPPAARGGDPMTGYSRRYYDALHDGIDTRVVDLKDAKGRIAFDTLLADADIFITSQRLAALARLQLVGEAFEKKFPRLIHIAIVGEQDTDDPGHDLTYLADAGIATPPRLPPTLLADLAGAERATTAAFAALRVRDATGRGTHVRVSLREAAEAFARPAKLGLTAPGEILGGAHPGYNFYRGMDGWIALAALETSFFARLIAALGIHQPPAEHKVAIAEAFATKPVAHWKSFAATHDLPLSVIPD
jgi:alpha-methylacyl-CoA racemase